MKKRSILIIDDDPDIIEALRIVLEDSDYAVDFAYNGEEGMIKAHKLNPDLIILDVMMTRTDEGFDVCREIKKDSSLTHIPILMLTALREKTGFDFKPEFGDSDWLPVEDYLDKPIQPDQLLQKVQELLGE